MLGATEKAAKRASVHELRKPQGDLREEDEEGGRHDLRGQQLDGPPEDGVQRNVAGHAGDDVVDADYTEVKK